MNKLNIYLTVSLAAIAAYTIAVGSQHGWNLLPEFFAPIADLTWQGQFNVDFTSFLALSGLWVAWRHAFSAGGLALGLMAFFGGMLFLATYLLWANIKAHGQSDALLLGEKRAQRLMNAKR